MGLKCFFLPCFAQSALQDVHESPGYEAKLKACGIFTQLYVPRHNEGAEIPFCGMMLIVFCPHLPPSDHPHPIISLAPQFLFQPFPAHLPIFSLFKTLVSHSHRPVMMFLSQASSQSCSLIQTPEVPRLSPVPGHTPLISTPCPILPRQHCCWLSALLPATPSCLTLSQSILQLLLLLKCVRVSAQTRLSHACS